MNTYSYNRPFSPSSFSYQQQPQNIDDLVYRYSSELDRGAPTEGIYARDGIWDDDEEEAEQQQSKRASTSTFGRRKTSGVKGRTSGAMSSVTDSPPPIPTIVKEEGGWGWGRRLGTGDKEKSIKEKKSFSKLRGKGRRGELSVAVNLGDDSDRLPTSSSTLPRTLSPTTSMTIMTPPLPHEGDQSFQSTTTTTTMNTGTSGLRPKLNWKKSMSKIFRTKSSAALREDFNASTPPPPVPKLPQPKARPVGKPFASSTPPMPLHNSRMSNFNPRPYSPGSAFGGSLYSGIPSPMHRDIPYDPFASSLDLSSNTLAVSPTRPDSTRFSSIQQLDRPRLPRSSPSLRDLKNFLPGTSKGKLTKAKSLANIMGKDRGETLPASAPADTTEFFPPPVRPGLLRRITSMSLLDSMSMPHVNVRPSTSVPSVPVESPPLLPPNPPYFPPAYTMRSSSLPVNQPRAGPIAIPSSLPSPVVESPNSSLETSPESNAPLTPGPLAPLPPLPLPSATTTPLAMDGGSTISRSGSSPVLLPRSRSTSMTPRAPPTSSSFFDLYAQLGIWPSQEKSQRETSPGSVSRSGSRNLLVPPTITPPPALVEETSVDIQDEGLLTTPGDAPHLGLSGSTSAAFSSSSWEAAVGAFPLIEEDLNPSALQSMAFDSQTVGNDDLDSSSEYSDAPETVPISNLSENTRSGGLNESTSASNTQHAQSSFTSLAIRSQPVGASYQMSRHGTGSGGSSRNSSRSRKPKPDKGKYDGWASESSDEEDDAPLSKLHPEAAAAQAQRKQASRQRKAMRAAAIKSGISVDDRGRRTSQKAIGRNPGGETGWNGEGGIPADVLNQKLERLLLHQAAIASIPHPVDIRDVRNSSRSNQGHGSIVDGSVPHRRSATAPVTTTSAPIPHVGINPLERSQTQRYTSSSTHSYPYSQPLPTPTSSKYSSSICGGPLPSRPSTTSSSIDHHHYSQPRPLMPRKDSATSAASIRLPPMPPLMTRQNTSQSHPSEAKIDLSRSNTITTQSPRRGRSRAQSVSSNRHGMAGDENMIRTAANEPMPGTMSTASSSVGHGSMMTGRVMHVKAYVGDFDGKRLTLEIGTETTAREVIVVAQHGGDLPEPTLGNGWMVCEVFAELGCERPVREYENLQALMRGWDQGAKVNCFVFRSSPRASLTHFKSIPTTAPFLGSFVQYESKPGKWSKRWLETRGGEMFLAKNEKNKDEIHLSTSFFDIYNMTRPYPAPKPFVFVLKRVEPSASFENTNEYTHVFACDATLGDKLLRAMYDAKSFTLHRQPQPRNQSLNQRRPVHSPNQPLIKLEKDQSAFTGKGLLKI